jgi:hypothetical protein
MSDSIASIATRFQPQFDRALRRRNIFEANRIAMELTEILFPIDPDQARSQVWKTFFSRLRGRSAQYQCYDFEAVDYGLYQIAGIKKLLRGPAWDLEQARSGYFTFLGAAQFFGRHLQHAPHALVASAIGTPCINLSAGGAGPEYFLSKEMLEVANGGLAVVLQVVSGRSVGCDEYPGGDVTVRKNGEKIKRTKLLGEIWKDSRDEAVRLTKRWQTRYVETMTHMLSQIEVPVVLVWMSARAPQDWCVDRYYDTGDTGTFPHLVDDATVRAVADKCAAFVEVSGDSGLPYHFVSRFTGEKCPALHKSGRLYWENDYYPSAAAAAEVSSKVGKVLQALIGGG